MSVPPVSPPSWRGAPVSPNATRAMSPAGASHTPPPGTRIDVRPPAPQRQQAPPPQQSYQQQPAPPPRRSTGRPSGRPSAKETASKRSTIITALAIVAAAVVGIMLASFLSSGDETSNASEPGSSASQAPPPATDGQDDAPEAGGGSKLPPKVTDPAGPNQSTQEQMLRDYFALAPDDPASSYQWLLPAMQAQNEANTYKKFWGTIKSVQVENISKSEDLAYVLDLKYSKKDGSTVKEKKLLVLKWEGDQLLIQREQLLGGY
jgi:hypothetical protein